jgi:hypothetical protein
MDFFAVDNERVARGAYWSLCGVGGTDLEPVRKLARAWLDGAVSDVDAVEKLSVVFPKKETGSLK